MRVHSWSVVLALAAISLGVAGGLLVFGPRLAALPTPAGSSGAVRARGGASSVRQQLRGAAAASNRVRGPRPGDVGGARLVLAVALLGISGLLFALAARLYLVRDGPLASLVARRSTVVVEATVTADPRVVGGASAPALGSAVGSTSDSSGRPPDGPPVRVAAAVRVTEVRSSLGTLTMRVPAVVMAPGAGWAQILPGQRVRFDGRLSPARAGDLLAATISTSAPPTLLGRPAWWQRGAETVRAALRRASAGLPARERGLLPGLVDGDTSRLDPLLAQQFRTAGLTHLVAVSGTNVAIVIGAILLLARRLRAPPWLAAAVAAVVLAAFVVVARPSPSVLRAAVMATVLLVALATGRARAALPALAVAVIVLLAWQPTWAADAGFAMSVLATAALLVLAPGWADALRRRRVPAGLAEGLAVATAASVVTAPVIVLLSGQVSLVSVPANLMAEVAVAPATVLGVLAAACGPWCPPLAAGLAQLAGVPCRWLTGVAAAAAGLPGATLAWPADLPGSALLLAVSVVVAAALRRRGLRLPLAAALLTVVVIQVPVRMWVDGWPVPGAILVACDVGQGDGLVIPVAAHAAIVVDDGRDPVPIDRCLRSLGISAVPLLVLSHFDFDHVGGTPGVVAGRQVGRVLTSPLQEPALGHGIVHAALDPRGIETVAPPTGTVIDVGPARVEVLASRSAQAGGQPDSNDSSLVVRIEARGRSMLFLGDAAEEEQQYLLGQHAQHARLTVDVLKVAHHGSAHFDPALYAATHASLAVVSVGAHNPYGHPTARALNVLARLSMPVVRTDQLGDIAVVPTATGLRTVSHPSHQTVRAGPAGASSPVRDVRAAAAVPTWSAVRTSLAVRTVPAVRTGTGDEAAVRAPTDDRADGPVAVAELDRVAAAGWASARAPPDRAPPCASPPPATVAAACHHGVVSVGPESLPGQALPEGVVLIVGDEEFLVERAVEQVLVGRRVADPTAETTEIEGATVVAAELHELLGPSLFGGPRTVVVRSAHEVPAGAAPTLMSYIEEPGEGATLVIQHVGGARGKAVLAAARSAAVSTINCARITKAGEREAFVRAEAKRLRARTAPEAVSRLIDAVGSDLRELAAVTAQLASDCAGVIGLAAVTAYHQGRAQVSGFTVADATVAGDLAGAMENLRWALSVGVPPVLIADALADGVRTVARVGAAGRGNAYSVASGLGLPPWKVERAQRQARGWSTAGLDAAMQCVADLNADVKGVAVDPDYALERAVRILISARSAA